MTDPVSQNARLDLLAADVYRVNPMDRDSGGRGDGGQFERSMKKKDEGEDPTGAEQKVTPKESTPLEDGVTLSEMARVALGGGPPSSAEVPRSLPDEPAQTPPDESKLPPHAISVPPGTRINLIA